MDHLQFIFNKVENGQREILIALLSDIGFEGFEEENDDLKAFVKEGEFNQELFDGIIENIAVKYSKSIIKNINWNEKWESGFEPVIVNHPTSQQPFAVVRAGFHNSIKDVLYDLVVTPKMSFGTGHHATTYLMIQQMSLLDFKDKTVIDFGTGTGVLAILAEKLGASNITAVDNDDWSINNAKENIEANSCSQIKLVKAETIEAGLKANIILANINLNIIIANLDAIKAACLPDATILFSGIMAQDEGQILAALKENNFTILSSFNRDNWLIIVTKR
ncbi:MAG: 50S ribosomal protein L11 methyltransferase [Ferruginibacter sp.]